MSGGDFKVTPGMLVTTSENLRSQARTLGAQLEQFNNDVAARSATWEGEAKESYTQKQGEWTAGMQQMQGALVAFAELVDQLRQDRPSGCEHVQRAGNWSLSLLRRIAHKKHAYDCG